MDKLALIDGNSLLNRAFFATPVFSTKDGRPTNGIFGFVKLLLKIISDEKPQYIAVTFDLHEPTFRHKMYDGYKANRHPMPEELAVQVEPLKELLSAMKIAMFQKAGYEADDLLGTISKHVPAHSLIYTGDRDSFQLVDEKTDVYYTKRGVSDILKLSKDNFEEVVKLTPSQIIDLKSLMGDKSDNIPGVNGIGETTARKLLADYKSLNGVYANLEDIKSPSVRKKLDEGRENAKLSYTLATIDRDCDIDIDLSACRTPQSYSAEVREMLIEFEFKTLLSQLAFDGENPKPIEHRGINVVSVNVDTAEALQKICSGNHEFYLHINEGVGFSMFCGGISYNFKCENAGLLCTFSYDDMLQILAEVFKSKGNHVVVYDFKRLLHEFNELNVSFACEIDDLSVMSYLAEKFDSFESFDDLCKKNGYDVSEPSFAIKNLYEKYAAEINEEGMQTLYEDIEKPLIYVLYKMESNGVTVDIDQLNKIGIKYHNILKDMTEKIYELCDCRFNINSPTQLGEVLFNKLGLKTGKKSKTGKYSTNAEVLESLEGEHEAVTYILKYRQYQKLYSTYIEGIAHLVDRKTNLIHTTYTQTVTATGRLSSVNPNLQNIPVREEEGRELRKLFIPRKGNILIDADYSQIELRLLAHFSGCKELIDAYNADMDVHAVTASQVFGVPLNEVTPKMRRAAKAVNFGIIYGISDYGLAKNIGTNVQTAKEYINSYFKLYSAVKDYLNENVKFARTHGFVATLSGRKRYIKEINSSNYSLRQFGERAAMNMPLQGSSADIIKIAMVNIQSRIEKEGLKTKLILQVHDELVLDAPLDEVERAAEILKYEMENATKLNVPLKVDVHCGENWYEAK